MKAYKAFSINENGDLQCRDMIYKVGDTYEMNELPILCRTGFHACLDINDLDNYYNVIDYHGLILGRTTVCEVELLGDIANGYGDTKIATNKIKIVRQLSIEETLTKMDASDYSSRPEIAIILDHSIDELTHDHLNVILHGKDVYLIQCILEKRPTDDYLLDKIVKHPQSVVRELLLALNLYRDKDLDILVRDEAMYIRQNVALIGRDKDLDILVHDESYWVRALVARRGRDKDLDILGHDEKYLVRKAIAKYGRDKDLDVLVHDDSSLVREAFVKHSLIRNLDVRTQGTNDVRDEVG